jgi:hypothetical protein
LISTPETIDIYDDMSEKICLVCEQSFSSSGRKIYCSTKCSNKFRNDRRESLTQEEKNIMNQTRKNKYHESEKIRDSKRTYRATKGQALRQQRIEVNNKLYLEHLRKGCVSCGELDILVLEFDHIANNKTLGVSQLRKCYSLERLKAEIDKCVVLCANCHKRRTAKQFGSWRLKHI